MLAQLTLLDKAVVADASARHRYLFIAHQLHKVPFSPSLMKMLLPALWKEHRQPTAKELWGADWKDSDWKDESVYSFFSRRFGVRVTEHMVDALVSGIWAADTQRLSVEATFPSLVAMERTYGSVTRGLLAQAFGGRGARFAPQSDTSKAINRIYSFADGLQVLPDRLAQMHAPDLKLQTPMEAIEKLPGGKVGLNGEPFDAVVFAVPSAALSKLLPTSTTSSSSNNGHQVRAASIVVVNLGFERPPMGHQGFGHLVPQNQNSPILGCVYDSCVFPQQKGAARLTVMMGGDRRPEIAHEWDEARITTVALEQLAIQSGVRDSPEVCIVRRHLNAIPQYDVGHLGRVKEMERIIGELSPNAFLAGNSFYGAGVNDCIARAKIIAQKIAAQLS
jgi:oxygen-dependent protoporphyrinogen oxidase